MPARIDITGNRFGRLIVLEYAFTKKKTAYWNCKCDCGRTCVVSTQCLRGGHTRSCGCFHKDQLVERQRKYNVTAPRVLYYRWCNMISRCENPSDSGYCNYGGRGIAVCDEWHDYNVFATWALLNGFATGLSIDRINNDGNYSPDNCRWATRKEQENNKRSNRRVEMDGETKTLSQWCEIYNINNITVQSRLRYGWTIEDAIKRPVNHKYHPARSNKQEEVL